MNRHDSAIFAAFAAIWIFVLIAVVGFYLFVGYCYKKIALKLGHDDDAKLWWIPIANHLILIRAAGRPDWWLIWQFVPFASMITSVLLWVETSQALGKSTGWGVLSALFPLPIGPAYLAFSEYEVPTTSLNNAEDVVIRWEE